MNRFENLFSAQSIGGVQVKNRIVFAPMLDRCAHEDGSISKTSIGYYRERAMGGAGMLIVGAVYFARDAHYRPNQTGLYDDSLVESHKRLTESVHEEGSVIGCQLHHAGIRLSQKAFGAGSATRSVGPSAVPFVITDAVPDALSVEEIHGITEAFSKAALRARNAGYDLVELHAGHGYLLHSFLSPFFNKREDLYGGSIDHRARFLCEVIRGIKRETGSEFPVSVRINGTDFLPGGIDIGQAVLHARLIEEAGADAIHVSAGMRETRHYMIPGAFFPQGVYAGFSEKIKKSIKIPVMTVGRYVDPQVAEQVLAEGKADFVVMGRALLADPELPNKTKEGKLFEIRPCIGCNEGCAARDPKKYPRVSCAVNAAVAREAECRIQAASFSLKVMVVGGGPAGMEAARVAALRGHRVSLYEKGDDLGGQLIAAAIPTHNLDIRNLKDFLVRQLKALGVEIHTGVSVSRELIEENKPDALVIAVGAQPVRPDIPGANRENVLLASDVLLGNADVGSPVVVAGGGLVGMETSLFLARTGKRVILVEMLPKIGVNANSLQMLSLMERLVDAGVQILTNTKLLLIHPEGVIVSMKQLTSENEVISIKADTVIMAMGYRPVEDLSEGLETPGCSVYRIGDCKGARKIIDAIHEGHALGLTL
ncbi:MAG: FAD-dependent oxidoreductase [Desulfobacterota bacterium]|nr:FAD-dependent oxidoreductase [Thermodesulfobacteriota bacterium]